MLLFLSALVYFAAEPYRKPPAPVMDILNAPATPTLSLSPMRAYALQGAPVRHPPIAELAEPMLRLAGIRINPRTNGLHNETFNTTLTLRKIPEGAETKVTLPLNPKMSLGRWSTMATISHSLTPPRTASSCGSATPRPARRAKSKACASTA